MEGLDRFKQESNSSFVDLQASLFEEFSIGPGQYSLKPLIPSGPYYSFGRASRFSHSEFYLSSETPVKELNCNKSPCNKRASSAKALEKYFLSPGPGAYDFSSTLCDKKISLRGKFQDLPVANTPGPGSYEVSLASKTRFPEFRDKRMKYPNSVTSNVDFLNNEYKTSSPSYSIGRRHRTASPVEEPGPGYYEVNSTLTSKAFTLMPKREPAQGLNTPGPGSYNIEELKKSAGFSIGLPLNDSLKNNVPGPGQYDVQVSNDGPKYSMAGRVLEKEEIDNREFPEITSSFGGRSALVVGKPKDFLTSDTPGPGAYSPSFSRDHRGPASVFSSREIKEQETPGPGQYSQDLKPEGPFYSIGKRASNEKIEEIPSPGPGHYECLPLMKNAPLLRGKPADLPVSLVPGPGHYEPSRSYTSFSFSQPRSNRFEEIRNSPGPGEYSPAVRAAGPGYSFGSGTRHNKSFSQSPGPGCYNPAFSDSRIAVLLRGKPENLTPSQVPGPGSYTLLDKSLSPSFTQPRSQRTDFTKPYKINPGPGSYENRADKPIGYSFSKEKRERPSPETSPGPGSYDWKVIDTKSGPIIRGKPAESQDSNVPGPGHYNTSFKDKSQSFQFGLKNENNFDNKVPGPGAYQISQRTDSPSWTIGKRRDHVKSEESPGPGTYDPLPTDSLKSFKFGLKIEEKIEATPGPGDYENPQSKSNGFTFGQKFDDKSCEYPGPGAYDPKLGKTNPAWTMNERRNMKQIEVSPGPGQYDSNISIGNNGPVFSKLERKFTPSKNPGPGQYNTSSSSFKDSAKYSIGKCSRTDFTKLKTNTPGPAKYYNEQKAKPVSGKFSRAKRENKYLADTKAPFVKVELKPDGPFYSIGAKRAEERREKTPGPGSYVNDLNYRPGTPAFTMGYRRSLFKKVKDFRNYTPVRSRK